MGGGALAGGAANALMFFSLFVGLILASLVVFSYASYSFLVTFVNTAAGNDEIMWPGEPIQDWFFKLWYFLWLLALWAVPVSLLLGLFRLSGLVSTGLIVGLIWLMFPVTLLSSMSGSSPFMVLRPVIVGRLLRYLGHVIVFYFVTGLLLAACCILFYYGVTRTVLLLLAAAVAGAAGFLVYARLLGRIALLISLDEPKTRRKSERDRRAGAENVLSFDPWSALAKEPEKEMATCAGDAPPRERAQRKKKPKARHQDRAYDPWAPPPEAQQRLPAEPRAKKDVIADDPYGPAEGTYELAAGEPHAVAKPPEKTDWLDVDPVPYNVSSSETREAKKLPLPEPVEVTKREEELAAPRRLPPLPAWPLWTGVYTFPFYGATLGPLGTLALGFFLLGGLLRLLFLFFPS